MDPGLHVKQAINHLNKIIAYVPYVKKDGKATVALTPEDWQVTADALFYMNQPKTVFPDTIATYSLDEKEHIIRLTLDDETEVAIEAG